MDTVKAVINLKEGVLELEGPQEFVEKYLDQYHSIIEKWQTSPLLRNEVTKESKAKEEKMAPLKRVRTVKTKTGPTCVEKIRELIKEGYFKEQRTRAEIEQYLRETKGLIYPGKEVAANLKNMFSRGEIQRLIKDRVYKYYSNV